MVHGTTYYKQKIAFAIKTMPNGSITMTQSVFIPDSLYYKHCHGEVGMYSMFGWCKISLNKPTTKTLKK